MALLKKFCLLLFVWTLILLALIMGGMRLVISNIEFFTPEIEYLLERDVASGIVFNRVSGTMNRFNPILQIENVSINQADRSQPLFIDRLEVEFDFWSSLRTRAPVVFEISGKLEKLELTRDVSGSWWLDEYQIDVGSDDSVLPGFGQLLELLPRYLKLDLHRLIIRDEKNQATHQLAALSARIDHHKGQFFTEVSADLPDEFGGGLLLKSVVDLNSSLIYLNTSELQLAPVARLFEIDTQGLKKGALDGEMWLSMSGYRVIAVKGDLDLKQGILQVTADKAPLAVDYHAKFNAVAGKQRWRISSKFERLTIDGVGVPGFDAQLDIPVATDDARLAAWIDQLPVSSLPTLAGQWLPKKFGDQISAGKLHGLLHDVLFEVDFDDVETFRLATAVEGLSSQRTGYVPGVTNLNADLILGNHRLMATLHGEAVSIDFGDRFRAPLEADSINMEVTMNRLPTGNLLIVGDQIELRNPDLNAVGRLRLETDGQNAPFMYLRASFTDTHASSTGKYLPVKLIPTETLEWLDRGIIGGYVPAGDLQFHGRLQDIFKLAREHAGEFFVDFSVREADIFFAPGWLHARNGKGQILFHNAGMEFDLEQASYENINGIKVRGGIADFEHASLDLAIHAEAPTRDAVRVWRDTPVGERFREVLANLQDYGGTVSTAIDIRLPLGDKVTDSKVSVEVDFKNAAVRAPGWGVDLSQITGRLKVVDDSIDARVISARFFDDPVDIDINSENMALRTLVSVAGNLASANLIRQLPSYLREAVTGNSDWQVGLAISGDTAAAGEPFLRINAASNLNGTRLAMPEPFRKDSPDSRRVTADVDFYPQEIHFLSRIGDDIAGRGTLSNRDDGEYRLGELEFAFSRALGSQRRPGIHLAGRINETNIDEWLTFFSNTGTNQPSLLSSVELGIDRAMVFGREADALIFELRQTDQHFYGSIDSSIVKGNFDIPLKTFARNPALINLDYLKIDELEQESDSSAIRPSKLPAFRLNAKSVRLHDMIFSDLLLDASPTGDLLEISKFDLRRDAVQISSSGQWNYNAETDQHLTQIKTRLEGPELGESLEGLGFGNSMSGGTIELTGDFSWAAAAYQFSLERLVGQARLKITDGVLNNVEPGGGRLVGLLSLNALPRRLTLDFSDVLIDGMEFDEITGSYRIADGILHTRNTRMDGVAAKIKMSGKTGIIARDYDQVIRVTPKIRQTLPLIGAAAVAASNPVGWGLLLLQNLFKTAIDDAVQIDYRLTGSWDDPKIELLKAVDENQKALPKIDK
jgi:uncharacterized protein (TIGR02099 family)